MEFGRVAEEDVKLIDHTLPTDGRITTNTLPGIPAAKGCSFFVGCGKWGRKEWKGMLYPKDLKEKDFLTEYARHFDSIELNACFYAIPSPEEILSWKEKVRAAGNNDFLFFPKMARSITHIKKLIDCGPFLKLFMEAVKEFDHQLGPIFLQVGDNFGPKQYEVLRSFLENDLSRNQRFNLEVRHPDWFSDQMNRAKLFQLLAKHKVGTVMSDASGRRDCLHMELPTRDLFVRFIGNGGINRDSDRARIDNWIQRIEKWVGMGLENVYFFVHQHAEEDTPVLASYAIKQFNQRLGAGLREIKMSGASL